MFFFVFTNAAGSETGDLIKKLENLSLDPYEQATQIMEGNGAEGDNARMALKVG